MMVLALPALVMLIGLLVYALTAHKQVGLVMFGCGLIVLVYLLAGRTVRLV